MNPFKQAKSSEKKSNCRKEVVDKEEGAAEQMFGAGMKGGQGR